MTTLKERLGDLLMPGSWVEHAACGRSEDPDMWTDNRPAKRVREAIEICQTCPVKQECLEYGIEIDDRFAIYGGQRPIERYLAREDREYECSRGHTYTERTLMFDGRGNVFCRICSRKTRERANS